MKAKNFDNNNKKHTRINRWFVFVSDIGKIADNCIAIVNNNETCGYRQNNITNETASIYFSYPIF
jgi:hypothetical protein